jgi:hypothetical protein
MRDEHHRFLSLVGQLPARLTAEQVACMLNCQTGDVPILVMARLLKPLGNPAHNGVKYFATADVIELSKDRIWLGKLTNAVAHHWRERNFRKKEQPVVDA